MLKIADATKGKRRTEGYWDGDLFCIRKTAKYLGNIAKFSINGEYDQPEEAMKSP